MSPRARGLLTLGALLTAACTGSDGAEEPRAEAPGVASMPVGTLELWEGGQPTFGVFVPDERPREERGQSEERLPPVYTIGGARALAENPLYDFLFLNLEGAYDVSAVEALATGLRGPDGHNRKTLLVRIPPMSTDGEDATRARISEILAMGGDGVVVPHVRNTAEAETVISFFADAGADVWTPQNPEGSVVAMLMLEDPEAVAQAEEIAALDGISVLACGIGSLTRAMDGDREGAEAGNRAVLSAASDAGLADMITANAQDVAARIDQGFLALLMAGPTADDAIQIGRAHAGR